MEINAKLLKHQYKFILDVDTRYLALVAGYGAGKTRALAIKAIYMCMLNIGTTGALLSPTGAMARELLVPELLARLDEFDIPYSYRSTPNPKFVLHFAQGDSTILIRSAEKYTRLVGMNLSWFGVDEADTIKPASLAHNMWNMLMSRLRVPAPHVQGFTTSTPEGFGFMYDYFVRQPKETPSKRHDRKLIQACTYDNPYLERDYIDSLLNNYPKNLIEAYLNGQFVNLNTNGAYPSFGDENILSEYDDTGKVLHIGVDFNVCNMNAVVFCRDKNKLIAIDEIQLQDANANTYSMVNAIKNKYTGRKIIIYPDATGRNRTANTTDVNNTNHEILRRAGFQLVFDQSGNPPIEDRTILVNAKIRSMAGDSTFYVHERCSILIDSLRQRQYKNGLPEKDGVVDHGCDCMDYVAWHLFNQKTGAVQYTATTIQPHRLTRRFN